LCVLGLSRSPIFFMRIIDIGVIITVMRNAVIRGRKIIIFKLLM